MTPEEIHARLAAARNNKPLDQLTTSERIRRLPLLDPHPSEYPALVEKWTDRYHLTRTDRRPLRPIQALALEHAEWSAARPNIGLLMNIAVGGGKTLVSLLLPKVFGAKRPLLITKAKLVPAYKEQLWEWANYYDFAPGQYTLCPYFDRVISYSQLSQPSATALLRELNPDLIVADECHLLRHPTSARTKRFLRFMQENPHVRFVGMSGTLTNSSISDYAHLSEIALREYSPLPTDKDDVDLWGSVLNVRGEPDDRAWGSVEAAGIDTEGREQQPTRVNFNKHFASVAGVVCSTGMSTEMPLTIEALRFPVPEAVSDALMDLSERWELPSGVEIVDALSYHRAMSQLSAGFYYEWDWPGEEDTEWLEARRGWWKACREYLKHYSREGVDSPFLVEDWLRTSAAPAPDLRYALSKWDAQRHKDPPPTKAIWIDPSPVYAAVGAMLSRPGPCLLWFESRAVGELLAKSGIETHWHTDPTPGRSCALSRRIHGTGKNYQAWAHNIDFEPTTNAAHLEQLMGRTHRQGQESPVWFGINQSTWAHRYIWRELNKKADYAEAMTGQPQKVNHGARVGFPEEEA